jgi:hypothetical protein
MNFYIADPLTNDTARVINNKLSTTGIVRTEEREASINGDAFLVATGYITFTVATPTAMLYIKNNEDTDIIIERFNANLEISTGGTTDYGRFIFYRNPEGLTNGSPGPTKANLNFGSSNALDVDFEIGDGSTSAITGVVAFASPIIPIGQVTFINGNLVLPKGTAFGIGYIPPAGNTSQSVGLGLNVFKSIIE